MKKLIIFLLPLGILAQTWTDNPNTKLGINAIGAVGESGNPYSTTNSFPGCPPTNYQSGVVQNGVTQSNFDYQAGCYGIISAWGGGTFDTKRNRLWLHGGGHVVTPDNTMWYYDLSVSPVTINRATGPSIVNTGSCPDPNPSDNTPPAIHTYQGLVYVPDTDKILRMMTSGTLCQGNDMIVWMFDPRQPATATASVSTFSSTACSGSSPCSGGQTSGWLVTVTTTAANTIAPGNEIVISSVTCSPASPCGINTTSQATPTSTTQFTMPVQSNPGTYSSGGSVAVSQWTQMATGIGSPPPDGIRCAWNPTRQKVDCLNDTTYWQEYDPMPNSPTFNTWASLANPFCTGVASCATSFSLDLVYDPVRKLMFAIGGSNNVIGTPGNLEIVQVDFSTGTSYASTDLSAIVQGCGNIIGTTGTSGQKTAQYPGLAYDPVHGDIAIYPGAGNSVYFFNPSTLQCTTQTASSGPLNTTHQSEDGTFGRFAYSPALGVYVTVLGVDADLYTFTRDATPEFGLGKSTFDCFDPDGDQYGVGHTAVGVPTALTDLVIDASNNKLVSSASYSFQANDYARHITLTTNTGGWTAGDYQIDTVSGGQATLVSSPGTVGSTGGSWSMTGCLGPDADNFDSSVHSASDALTKYGSISGWMTHLGFTPTRIWYENPTTSSGTLPNGSNSTGAVCTVGAACDTNPGVSALPYATYAAINASVTAGDAVVYGNLWNGLITPPTYTSAHTGAAGAPIMHFAFPGELPTLDPSGFAGAKINMTDVNYNVIHGFRMWNGAGIQGGTTDSDATQTTITSGGQTIKTNFMHNMVLENEGLSNGTLLGAVSAFNGLFDFTIKNNVFHGAGPNSQHNIYIGSRAFASANVGVIGNILYDANYNCLHENGQMFNTVTAQNLIYNCDIAGISPQNGVAYSYFSSNTVANAGTIIDIDDYEGSQLALANTCHGVANGTVTVTAASWASGTVTVTTNIAEPFVTGDSVQINLMLPSGYEIAFGNGPAVVTVIDSTHFSYALVSNPGTYTSGGAVSTPGCNCGASGAATCTCPLTGAVSTFWNGPQQNGGVCPYNQNHNVWENNTFYSTGSQPCGNNRCTLNISSPNQSVMVHFNQSNNATLDLGNSVWRNNHFIGYGNNNGGMPIYFYDCGATLSCGLDTSGSTSKTTCTSLTNCSSWAASDTFDSNIWYQTDTHHATGILQIGSTSNKYTCATLGAQVAALVNCKNADPLFVAAQPSYTTEPGLFSFHLVLGSPGTHAGSLISEPTFDQAGLAYAVPTISIGALEFVPSNCNITTTSLPSGLVGVAYSQTLAFTGCAIPVTWSVTSGSLPGWMSLNTSTGVLSGNPNAAATTSFTIGLLDNVGNSDTQPLSITINASGRGGCILLGPTVLLGNQACI